MQRKMRVGLAVVGMVAVVSGCGGEKLAEEIAENRIEAEGGGDVDIDLGDGEFSVKTEDGEFSVKTDDDGNVSIQGSGQDGDGSVRIDSENGETVVEGDDGTAVFSQSGDLPDGFPHEVPVPDGVSIVFAQSLETSDGGTGYSVAATTSRDRDDLLDEMTAALEANGFDQQQLTTTPDGSIFVYSNSTYGVTVVIGESNDDTSLSLTVTPTT